MFLQMISGIEKLKEGYVEVESLSLKSEKRKIPEVHIIEKNSEKIHEALNRNFKLKVCITGHYTLSALFAYKNEKTFLNLGKVLAEIAKENIFENKYGEVCMVTLDEPTFGVMSDPMIDYGAPARETLLKAWETIFKAVSARGVTAGMHLHSTADELFWQVESLDLIESHINRPAVSTRSSQRETRRI